MKSLFNFIQKYSFILLFILLEGIAFAILVRGNYVQHSVISRTGREISGRLMDRVKGTREYFVLRELNQDLSSENTRLRNLLAAARDSAASDSLKNAEPAYFFMKADVVRNTVNKQYNFITLNAGRNQGVQKDMGVITETGVVGIVVEASPNFSIVIPAINRDFRLSGRISSSDYVGIVQWDGTSPSRVTLGEIPYHVVLHEGDSVVTSGYSAIFPPGLLIGTIENFSLEEGNFFSIDVKLAVDFRNLYHVNIIRNAQQDEQLELEAQNEK
ncbi:MAG: rod shape-determining protein MreC [Bacteroidota bacterium]